MSKEVRHPIFARVYARAAAMAEEHGAEEHRERLLAGLEGRVLEMGCGHGLNFPHYPATVRAVVAVEPEDHLRSLAERAAADAPVEIEVVDGVADRLPAEDESFDAAVASLVLCSVPDQASALAELRRVLRPGGELRFYEHVIGEQPGTARMQRVVGRVWPLFTGGCHPDRDTVAAIERAGFEVEDVERFTFRPSPVMIPVAPHVIGRARRA